MTATTIKVHEETKTHLDSFREYRNESYDEVINKLVYMILKNKHLTLHLIIFINLEINGY